MNVSCGICRSVFRVDPARVPVAGIRARCSVCGGVISIASGSARPEDAGETRLGLRGRPEAPSAPANTTRSREEMERTVEAIFSPVPPGRIPRAQPSRDEFPDWDAADAPRGTPDAATHAIRPTPIPRPKDPPVPPPIPAATAPSGGSATPSATTHPAREVPPAAPTGGAAREALSARPAPPAVPALGNPVLPHQGRDPRRLATGPVTGMARPTAARSASPAVGALHGGAPTAPRQIPAPTGAGDLLRPSTLPQATPLPGQTRRAVNPFLSNDPNVKAKRLARALVSDMVTYLPQKREEGLHHNTLKTLFREEIKKSFEEYVDQVGREVAEGTTHFQEALNEILAGGRKLF